ncbi:hypothetical protein IAI09_08180 [Lysinibacillus fusiformis]|nr:hypothetical protein [Lysinibacillus fusiformis]
MLHCSDLLLNGYRENLSIGTLLVAAPDAISETEAATCSALAEILQM